MVNELDSQVSQKAERAAVWLRLADDEYWGFAQPTITLRPEFRCDSSGAEQARVEAVARLELGYPPQVQLLLERIRTGVEVADEQTQRTEFTELAIALLQQVHDLNTDAASRLLGASIELNPALIFEILLIALGGRLPSCEPQCND